VHLSVGVTGIRRAHAICYSTKLAGYPQGGPAYGTPRPRDRISPRRGGTAASEKETRGDRAIDIITGEFRRCSPPPLVARGGGHRNLRGTCLINDRCGACRGASDVKRGGNGGKSAPGKATKAGGFTAI